MGVAGALVVACDGGVTEIGSQSAPGGAAGAGGTSGGLAGAGGSAAGAAGIGGGSGGIGATGGAAGSAQGGASGGGAGGEACATSTLLFEDDFERPDGPLGSSVFPGGTWAGDSVVTLASGAMTTTTMDSADAFSPTNGALGYAGILIRFKTRLAHADNEVQVRVNSNGMTERSGVGVELHGPGGLDVLSFDEGLRRQHSPGGLVVDQDLFVEVLLNGPTGLATVSLDDYASTGGTVFRSFAPILLLQDQAGINLAVQLDGKGFAPPTVDEIVVTRCE